MKVAIHQTDGVPLNPSANLARLRDVAADASKQGADLLVLPELWLTGYNIGDAVRDLAEPRDGPSAMTVAEIATSNRLAILFGYPEHDGEHVFNAALLIDRDGRPLVNAKKAHLFGTEEKRLFRPGDRDFALVQCAGMRLGILICYDVEFPESARALALAGAELIVVPTALMDPFAFIASHVVPVRAFENQVFVAYANRIGREGDLVFCGGSSIVGPDGVDLARAGRDEALLLAELDAAGPPELATNTYLADRRPQLYGKLVCISPGRRGERRDTSAAPGIDE